MLNCHPKRLDSFVYLLTAYENACLPTFLSLLVFLFFFYFCVLTDKIWHLIGSLCILKITNENYKWERTFLMNCLFLFLPNFLLGCLFFPLLICNSSLLLKEINLLSFLFKYFFPCLLFFFWFCWRSVFCSLEAYNFWFLFSQTHQWGGWLILIRALMFDTNTMLYIVLHNAIFWELLDLSQEFAFEEFHFGLDLYW